MGDRANVYVHNGTSRGVYLYTHWAGSRLAEIVRTALASRDGRGRWDDVAYLTRIIARTMGMGADGETGYGIAALPCDNEHPIVCVDTASQEVTWRAYCKPDGSPSETVLKGPWSFESYADLDPDALSDEWDAMPYVGTEMSARE